MSDFTNQNFTQFDNGLDEIITYGTIRRHAQFDGYLTWRNLLEEFEIMANHRLIAELNANIHDLLPQDCDEVAGLTDFFRDLIQEFDERLQRNEWGAMLISNNGNVSFYRSQVYSQNSRTRVDHNYSRNDAANIVNITHNHPDQNNRNANLENRYPSDDDWNAAAGLVQAGANPDVLTLSIVDSQGDARVFRYSERQFFQSLSATSRRRGVNLPPEVPFDANTDVCVTID